MAEGMNAGSHFVMNYKNRIKIQENHLRETEFDAVMITHPDSIRYLTGLRSHGQFDIVLILGHDDSYVITNSLYSEAISQNVEDLGCAFFVGRAFEQIQKVLRVLGAKNVGFESNGIIHFYFLELSKILNGVSLSAYDKSIQKMREVKDEEEIALLREAAKVTDSVFNQLIDGIHTGMSELEVASMFQILALEQGGFDLSFDTIVAFGENSSKPHHFPSSKRFLQKGDTVLFDLGLRVEGYGADMTRVGFCGTPDEEFRRVVDTVTRSKTTAEKMLKTGVDMRTLDTAAKQVIRDAGFEPYSHGLGHGIGIDETIHELPIVSEQMKTPVSLIDGMVFTIEPGIYIPGKFGVRIEDNYIFSDNYYSILSQVTTDIICI